MLALRTAGGAVLGDVAGDSFGAESGIALVNAIAAEPASDDSPELKHPNGYLTDAEQAGLAPPGFGRGAARLVVVFALVVLVGGSAAGLGFALACAHKRGI